MVPRRKHLTFLLLSSLVMMRPCSGAGSFTSLNLSSPLSCWRLPLVCHTLFSTSPQCSANSRTVSLSVRMYAIWDKSRTVMLLLGALLFIQIVTQAICCAFYQVVPLKETQGCIAGPKHNWVGVYWLAPTLFYTATVRNSLPRLITIIQALKLISI